MSARAPFRWQTSTTLGVPDQPKAKSMMTEARESAEFPGWFAAYLECGHGLFEDRLPRRGERVCRICTQERKQRRAA